MPPETMFEATKSNCLHNERRGEPEVPARVVEEERATDGPKQRRIDFRLFRDEEAKFSAQALPARRADRSHKFQKPITAHYPK